MAAADRPGDSEVYPLCAFGALSLSLDIIAKCLISWAFGPSGTAFDLSLRRASAMLAG
jgi:hypothetical protein